MPRRHSVKLNRTGLEMYESDIQLGILSFLNTRKGYYFPMDVNGVFSQSIGAYLKNKQRVVGVSDILGIYPDGGRWVAIEVKRPSNRKRPEEQIEFLDRINRNGGVGIFADNLDTVMELFDRLDKGKSFEDLKEDCLERTVE